MNYPLVSNLRMSQKVSHELDVGLSPDDMAVNGQLCCPYLFPNSFAVHIHFHLFPDNFGVFPFVSIFISLIFVDCN